MKSFRKILIRGLSWNMLCSFLMALVIDIEHLGTELWIDLVWSTIFAIFSSFMGLLLYAAPLYLFYTRKSHRAARLYAVIMAVGTALSVFLLCFPPVMALLSITAGEYHYTQAQLREAFLSELWQLTSISVGYAGSYLGYIWAYWKEA